VYRGVLLQGSTGEDIMGLVKIAEVFRSNRSWVSPQVADAYLEWKKRMKELFSCASR
jgi:hypothetical protein